MLGHTAVYSLDNRHTTLDDYRAYLEYEHSAIQGLRDYKDTYGNMLQIMVQM